MKRAIVVATCLLVLGATAPAFAQEGTRPATNTVWGDTGLWFVPTGEVLPNKEISVSAHRTEFDFRQGNTSVSSWPITGAVGIGRAEFFGSMHVVTRIDRDTVPLLFTDQQDQIGGLLNEYPTVHESWTGNKVGDLYLGGKVNLYSQQRQAPMALAFRGTVKLPTGDSDTGASTGEWDWFADVIGSREAGGVEYTAFGGFAWRGDPADISLSDGFRWGGGIGFPTRRPLRFSAEVSGEWTIDKNVTAPAGFLVGDDGSRSPATSRIEDAVNTTFGVTYQHRSGILLGAALNYRFDLETDQAQGTPANTRGDAIGLEFRIGFHRGVNVFVPPPPPAVAAAPEPPAPAPAPAPPPPPPAPRANTAPTVRAIAEPSTVQVGQTVKLRAQANDPDADTLMYQWTASGGTLGDPRTGATEWRAETAPGLIRLSVTVEDGRGGKATDTVTVEVTPLQQFEDVLFDFDSSMLRPTAITILEPVVAELNRRTNMTLMIEGHTCNVGTAEYNLALGERRANAVREFLISRGIASTRLSTVTYGEEQPKFSNDEESTRMLNRRAVLIAHGAEDSSR